MCLKYKHGSVDGCGMFGGAWRTFATSVLTQLVLETS
jgi:hypothetical protein